jgi:hypothetical protein
MRVVVKTWEVEGAPEVVRRSGWGSPGRRVTEAGTLRVKPAIAAARCSRASWVPRCLEPFDGHAVDHQRDQ